MFAVLADIRDEHMTRCRVRVAHNLSLRTQAAKCPFEESVASPGPAARWPGDVRPGSPACVIGFAVGAQGSVLIGCVRALIVLGSAQARSLRIGYLWAGFFVPWAVGIWRSAGRRRCAYWLAGSALPGTLDAVLGSRMARRVWPGLRRGSAGLWLPALSRRRSAAISN